MGTADVGPGECRALAEVGALAWGAGLWSNLFDVARGWQGRHTLDVPVVVVTHHVPTDWVDAHPDAPFSFVTTGVQGAISRAQELAGDHVVAVAVAGGTIARHVWSWDSWTRCAVDLVPVVMGAG